MTDQQFLRYVGPPILHDASIVAVRSVESTIEVELRSQEGLKFIVRFDNARVLSSVSPEGMLVYSLSELRTDPPLRRFSVRKLGREREIRTRD